MDEFLSVGRITGYHGLKGELKLLPYGGLDEFEWARVFLLIEGKRRSFTVKSVRRQRGSFIIAFEGFRRAKRPGRCSERSYRLGPRS